MSHDLPEVDYDNYELDNEE